MSDQLAADGLFSHPDTDHLNPKPGPAPVEDQRSYTNLFQQPAGTHANDQSTA